MVLAMGLLLSGIARCGCAGVRLWPSRPVCRYAFTPCMIGGVGFMTSWEKFLKAVEAWVNLTLATNAQPLMSESIL